MWLVLATVLLAAVYADSSIKGLQMFMENEKSSTQKQHKREPKYEYKEVILYLTPTQIRAFEAGQGLIQQPAAPPEFSSDSHQTKEQAANSVNEAGQQFQREYEKLEADRMQQLQLQETAANANEQKEYSQLGRPYIDAAGLGKQQWHPDNYAYFYFYPQGKPDNNKKSQTIHAKQQTQNEHLVLQKGFEQQNFQLVPYEYGLRNTLEAKQFLQEQLGAELLAAHQDDVQWRDAAQNFAAQHLQQQQLEAPKLAAHQLEVHQLRAQKHQAVTKLQEAHRLEAHKLEAHQQRIEAQIKEAHRLKETYQKQELEAERLDAELEEEERKAEQFKEEQKHLFHEYEPKNSEIHTILNPLLQYHNILESLNQHKLNLPSEPQVEGGFRPLLYAPKYNNEKYAKGVDKILQKNHIEKQKALATAAAIAQEPPVIIKDEVQITNHKSNYIIKHVNVPVPTPVYVPYPEPFQVNVPQPYAVPVEILRPIPVPIVKTEKVEIQKPFSIMIEKHVPIPVTKNFYVNLDKPYSVKRGQGTQELSSQIEYQKSPKFSIIKHVWGH